ncbi:MAG: hypothetical protein JST85_05045 [Acidobacteria bacterium]|nr:hypothetical protein [Acidobacteriota bacterium]
MFVKDNLQRLKVFSEENFSNTKFLMMFVGVVIAPLVFLVVGGRTSETLWQSGLVWTLLIIGLLPTISVVIGLKMYRSKSRTNKPPSIIAKIV